MDKRNIKVTYLLDSVWHLEMRIIATYFTLIRQPIYHFSFCGNLLASPTLCVHPVIPALPAYSIGSTLHKAIVTSSKLDFCWMLKANKFGLSVISLNQR